MIKSKLENMLKEEVAHLQDGGEGNIRAEGLIRLLEQLELLCCFITSGSITYTILYYKI